MYGDLVTPSTEALSIPSLMSIANGVPAMIDCPTTVCFHATGAPRSSVPIWSRWRKRGAVVAAREVVFACPDRLHGDARRLRDLDPPR